MIESTIVFIIQATLAGFILWFVLHKDVEELVKDIRLHGFEEPPIMALLGAMKEQQEEQKQGFGHTYAKASRTKKRNYKKR